MTEVSAGTLTDFLLARISDDEDRARTEPARLIAGRLVHYLAGLKGYADEDDFLDSCNEAGDLLVRDLAGRTYLDASRVLAECEAKRQIVEIHQIVGYGDATPPRHDDTDGCIVCDFDRDCGDVPFSTERGPCATLRLLALPYAGHAEFNPAWRL